jgi:predicted metal-dependent peptidase
VGLHNNGFILLINEKFWNEDLRQDNHKLGVLTHEVLHLLLRHPFRASEFKNHRLFNIAADLVVNQLVRKEDLPEQHINLSTFQDYYLEKDQSLEYYYNKLDKLKNMLDGMKNEKSQALNKGESQSEEIPGHNGNESRNGKSNFPYKSLEALDSLLGEELTIHISHELWKQLQNLPDLEKEIVLMDLARLAEKALGIGKLPGYLEQDLGRFLNSRKAQINWKFLLRSFVARSSKTFIKSTIKRRSKRFGTSPGIKVKRKAKILVAVDTSGSVGNEELEIFFNEIYHIWKTGAEVWVVECDTIINESYSYKGVTPETVSGGGGTSFDEPIHFANSRFMPDAIIYLTDGGGTLNIKSRRPLLWVITRTTFFKDHADHLPGQKLFLNLN